MPTSIDNIKNLVIAFSRPDGTVNICNPASTFLLDRLNSGSTEAEALAACQAKSVPDDATNVEIMERSTIPTSRVFRNAWVKPGVGAPTVDMPKARDLHMVVIKRVRDKELVKLDVAYMRSDEAGDNTLKASIATQKQALRDLPTTFDMSVYTTPDALEASWPDVLPPR